MSNYRTDLLKYYDALLRAWHWWLQELSETLDILLPFNRKCVVEFEVSKQGDLSLKSDASDFTKNSVCDISLIFSDNNILYRKIKLPDAARKNIDKVVSYEFNTYFPLNIDNAIVSYSVRPSSSNKDSIEVEIWSISKAITERCLREVREKYKFVVRHMKIANSDAIEVISHDVLRAERSDNSNNNTAASKKLNYAILFLLLTVLIYPVLKMDSYIDDLEQKVAVLEQQARPILSIRNKIIEKEQRLQTLISVKNNNPDMAYVWSRISNTLASKAALDSMAITGHQVKLEGRSPSVERVISILELDSEFADVKLNGSVNSTGKNSYETLKLSMSVGK